MWTLNGQKIVFLSTNSSLRSSTSCELKGDAPHQLKAINADGSGESIIYSKKFYYASITVSNSGQIIFLADMISQTSDDYFAHSSSGQKSWYRMNLEENESVKISGDTGGRASLSPNGKYLAYKNTGYRNPTNARISLY
jgi:hypothetical protein